MQIVYYTAFNLHMEMDNSYQEIYQQFPELSRSCPWLWKELNHTLEAQQAQIQRAERGRNHFSSPKKAEYQARHSTPNWTKRIKIGLVSATAGLLIFLGAREVTEPKQFSQQEIAQAVESDKQKTEVLENMPQVTIESQSKALLNQILAAPFGSKEEIQLEKEYVQNEYVTDTQFSENTEATALWRSKVLERVNLGLIAVEDLELRKDLVEIRYELRQLGTKVLRPLTQEEVRWAEEQDIHPEVLAIATDQYFAAKQMLQDYMTKVGRDQFWKEFRPDLVYEVSQGNLTQAELDSFTIDDILINPGGLAALAKYETSGFINVGAKRAYDQLSPEEQVTFSQIMKEISKETGLKINPQNIAGSDAGASGMQIMPETAKRLRIFFKKHLGVDLNHLDPSSGALEALLMLAQGEEVGDDYRYGVLWGSKIMKIKDENGKEKEVDVIEQIRKKGLNKWNQLPDEVNAILSGAYSYYGKFIGPAPDKFNKVFAQQYQDAKMGIFYSLPLKHLPLR